MSDHFTPGPWKAEGPDIFGDYNIVRDNSDEALAIGAVVSNLRPPATVAANARLSAAAPEMLDEIMKQIKWLQHLRQEATGHLRGSLLTGIDQSIKYLTAIAAKATHNLGNGSADE